MTKEIKFSHSVLTLLMLAGFLAGLLIFQVVIQHKEPHLSSIISDYERDYLVANHIVRYAELPLTGPDQKFGSLLSSPLYFYLLAALLSIRDSIIVLGIAGVALKTLFILLAYGLARTVFGSGTALIAASLAAGVHISYPAPMPLQTIFMLFFVTLSYVLLALSFEKKNYALLLLGIFTFSFSLALHFSVLAVIPLFAFMMHRTLKVQDQNLRKRAAAFLFLPLSAALFFLSNFYYFSAKGTSYIPFLFSLVAGRFSIHPSLYAENLLSNMLAWLSFSAGRQTGPLMVAFSVFVLVVLILYFYLEPPSPRKRHAGHLAAGIVSFHVLAASLYLPGDVFQSYYFFPIAGLFAVLMAEALRGTAAQLFLARANLPALISVPLASLFYALVPLLILIPAYPSYVKTLRFLDFSALFSYPPGDYAIAVEQEVRAIKARERREDFLFFQFRYYRDGKEAPPVGFLANETFWMPLEELLSAKLTRLDDVAYRDFTPMGSAEYLFLRCDYQPNEEVQQCVTPFLDDYSGYALVKKIYSKLPYSIYEMRYN